MNRYGKNHEYNVGQLLLMALAAIVTLLCLTFIR